MDKTAMSQDEFLKGTIEALLFVNEKTVTLEQIKSACDATPTALIKQTIKTLQEEYVREGRGMSIQEIAGGFQMLTNPDYAEVIRRFYKTQHKERLSKPALETLAIVAYKQPVTRGEIELIRGVNSDGVVTHLVEKELIKIVGRKDVAGRPYVYGTTKQFLEYFGLKSLENLPKMEEFAQLEPDSDNVDDENPTKDVDGETQEVNQDEHQNESPESPAAQKEEQGIEDEHKEFAQDNQ